MDPFYASIKFKSEEEVLCFVRVADPELDHLVIENPIAIEEVDIPGVVQGIRIKPWMKVSQENSFTIYGEDLLSIKELNPTVSNFYKSTLAKISANERMQKLRGHTKRPPIPHRRKRGRIPMNEDMGLIGSVDVAREYLENVFRLDYNKDQPDKA